MNRKIRFLNLKSLKKRIWSCHVFYLNYGEVRTRRSSVLGFLYDSLFHRWSCYIFSLLSDCHSSLFCKESVILVFYSRLPQSYDQNTKLHKTLCLRVGSKNKENINLQSHLSLDFFFYLKNVLGACSNQATETDFKDSDFWCGKISASMFFQRYYGRNRKSYWYLSHQEIINCSF